MEHLCERKTTTTIDIGGTISPPLDGVQLPKKCPLSGDQHRMRDSPRRYAESYSGPVRGCHWTNKVELWRGEHAMLFRSQMESCPRARAGCSVTIAAGC